MVEPVLKVRKVAPEDEAIACGFTEIAGASLDLGCYQPPRGVFSLNDLDLGIDTEVADRLFSKQPSEVSGNNPLYGC